MKEALLRILLSELELVRVRCLDPACRRVVEVSIGKLGSSFPQNSCPFCGKAFQGIPPYEPIRDQLFKLGEVVMALKAAKDKGQIEVSFDLPDKG